MSPSDFPANPVEPGSPNSICSCACHAKGWLHRQGVCCARAVREPRTADEWADYWRWEDDPLDRSSVLLTITEALEEGREVNGGEWESVLTIYRPEGLAFIVLAALRRNGWEVVRR